MIIIFTQTNAFIYLPNFLNLLCEKSKPLTIINILLLFLHSSCYYCNLLCPLSLFIKFWRLTPLLFVYIALDVVYSTSTLYFIVVLFELIFYFAILFDLGFLCSRLFGWYWIFLDDPLGLVRIIGFLIDRDLLMNDKVTPWTIVTIELETGRSLSRGTWPEILNLEEISERETQVIKGQTFSLLIFLF